MMIQFTELVLPVPCMHPLAGLIAAGMFAQATDPDSPRMGVPVAPAQPNSTHPADDASGCTGEEAQAASAEHSVQPGGESFVVKIPAAGGGGSAGGGAGGGGGDYLAALHSTGTNPFETSALRQEDEEQPLRGASAKATQKLEMLQQVPCWCGCTAAWLHPDTGTSVCLR